MIERYAVWIVRYRWLVIIFSVIATLALATGGKNLSFTNDYRVFFSKENPQLLAYAACMIKPGTFKQTIIEKLFI